MPAEPEPARPPKNRLSVPKTVNVTAHPSAEWTLQQLREAIPADHRYRFLIHDRDSVFSRAPDRRIGHLGLRVLKTPVRPPVANAIGELPVVLVVPLTTTRAATRFAGTTLKQSTAENGLRQVAVTLVFQLRAIDRRRMQERIGRLGEPAMVRTVEAGKAGDAVGDPAVSPVQTTPRPTSSTTCRCA
jgi:mRNA-degrading endonuclease toxin of MazEF toxin-antitoxin module